MIGDFKVYNRSLSDLSEKKMLITTINAHSYNVTRLDSTFRTALLSSDVLIPDGISIVWAIRLITGISLKKIAGADLFFNEMERLQKNNGKCFFLGSSDTTLKKIKSKTANDYPKVQVHYFSPPYKKEFSDDDNQKMIEKVNAVQSDVLFVGMTAPKQEKWAYQHFKELQVGHVCCIGAVFDFYAGTTKRAPMWMIRFGLEWLFRLLKEPKRMWRRYLIGNLKFIYAILMEKIKML